MLEAFKDYKKACCSVGVIEVCVNVKYNHVKAAICLYDSFAIQKFLNSEGGLVALCHYCVAGFL